MLAQKDSGKLARFRANEQAAVASRHDVPMNMLHHNLRTVTPQPPGLFSLRRQVQEVTTQEIVGF
jgi:hypothetical protein